MAQSIPHVSFSRSASTVSNSDRNSNGLNQLNRVLQGRVGVNGSPLLSGKRAIPPFNKNGLLETSGYAISANKAISHREAEKFIKSNQDLLYVIEKDETLKKEALKMSFSKRQDLEDVIAKRAFDLLSDEAQSVISEKDLKEQSLVSSMIVLNTGGLKDFINEDKQIAEYFSGGGESIAKAVYKKLADLATELFPNAHPLNDAQFMADNPRVAVYLLGHKDIVRDFIKEPDGDLQAAEFKQEVNLDAYRDLFEGEVNRIASENTNSGSFNESYFASYDELATFVAASSFLSDAPEAGQLLKQVSYMAQNNLVTRDSFNMDSFMKNLLTSQVSSTASDSGLSSDKLKSHFGFARLFDSSPEFSKNLKRKEDTENLQILIDKNYSQFQLSDELKQSLSSSYRATYKDLPASYAILR